MVEQLSVFLQNKPGKIASVTRALADAGVDIRALSIADTTDFGVLRMLVSDMKLARTALTALNCILSATSVTVVAVPDVPGGLARVLELLGDAKIDIEYMYSIIGRGANSAYMVFRVSDEEALGAVLQRNGIGRVTAAELGLR